MENSNDALAVDPAADLALLRSAKGSVELRQGLHPGPWWLMPVLAAIFLPFGSPEVFFDSIARMVGANVALCMLAAFMAWYTYTRGPVPGTPSITALAWAFALGIPLSITLFLGWVMAGGMIGHDNFFPLWSIVGWLLTTLVLLGVRLAVIAFLGRRTILS